MEITLNSKALKIENSLNINELLSSQGYKNKTLAIAVNGNFVPKSSYDTYIISNKDDIEVVAPMQGG